MSLSQFMSAVLILLLLAFTVFVVAQSEKAAANRYLSSGQEHVQHQPGAK